MAVNPALMRVDYAGQLGQIGQNIGRGIQGYKQGVTRDLAGQAMMGDPAAMEQLMMRDPSTGVQVQQQLQAQQAAQQERQNAILGKLAEEKRSLFESMGGAASPEEFSALATRAIQSGMYPTIAATMGEGDQIDAEDYAIAQTFHNLSLDPDKKTTLIRNMEAMGLNPASPEGQKFMKEYLMKAGGTNITIGGAGGDGFGADKAKFAEKLAEKQANQWEAQTERADAAEQNMVDAEELLRILDSGLETGALAPLRAGVDKFTEGALGFSLTGIDPKLAERFQGLSTKLARQLRQPGEGIMTDADAKAYEKVIGGLGTSVDANRRSIEAFKRTQQRNRTKAQEMDSWITKTGSLSGFKEYWNSYIKQNPLFVSGPGDGEGASSGGTDVESLLEKYR